MQLQTPNIDIRLLTTHAEFTACVDIQAAVWGGDPTGFTSAALLKASHHSGGIVAGALTPADEVIGFVYSFIGRQKGHPIHWSHQLAVLPAYEGYDIGRCLKAFQREVALTQHLTEIRWTFDPMLSINAHFNLNKLGAVCGVFMPDAYGEMVDDLNAGMPSDRFECHWPIAYKRVEAALTDELPSHTLRMWRKAGAHLCNPTEGLNPPTAATLNTRCAALLITIPTDFTAIKHSDKAQALAWQTNVRESFTQAFDAGYEARRFIRGPERGYYVLLKKEAPHAH